MSRCIVPIVEGHGDTLSIPIILRRLAMLENIHDLRILDPQRVGRQKIVRPGELEKAIELAARRIKQEGGDFARSGVLVLLDSDDDAPCKLGPDLLARARNARGDLAISVVLAAREKESWYVAAIESIAGKRFFPENLTAPDHPESIRDAKGWLARARGGSYSETTDQPALARIFEMEKAHACSSFRKLVRDVKRLLRVK